MSAVRLPNDFSNCRLQIDSFGINAKTTMKNTRIILAAFLASAAAIPAFAQFDVEDEPNVTVIVGDKSNPEEVEIEFVRNAPAQKRIHGLPRFAIVGNDRKFYLGVGAQFLGEGVFDFGDAMPSPVDFVPSTITPAAKGDRGSFRFSALTSSFYINAVALPGTKNRVGLFFKAEINNGNDYGFSVSHFYVNYRGFNVGYTSTLFQDGAAMPFTIDNQGPNGSAAMTVFTANYTQDFGKGFSGAIGIENPTADMNCGSHARQVSQRIPAVPLYLQYAWGGGASHIRLSGMVRPLQYRDLVADKNRTICGAGVQLSGLVSVADPFTLYYGATYGKGIADYMQDDTGMNLDAVAEGVSGKCKAMTTFGVTAGLSYKLTDRLTFNGVYSHLLNSRPDNTVVDGDTYRYGDYVAANLYYTFNKILAAGIEYDYGHVADFNNSRRHTNRIQAQLAVSF